MTTAITTAAAFFSDEQERIIRDSFLNGATKAEASVLLELARARRLNPITRQIHFVKRWDSEKQREVWSAQVAIDGFRSIAEDTGKYAGQDEPEFEYDEKGQIKLCRVKIYRSDWSRPVVGVAHFSEYAQTKKDGSLTKMWKEKGHIMISKCAEALGFRKAFPQGMSGIYTPEEMGAEKEEKDVTPVEFRTELSASNKKEEAIETNQPEWVKVEVPKSTPPPPPQIAPKPQSNVDRAKALMREKLVIKDMTTVTTPWGRVVAIAAELGWGEVDAGRYLKQFTGKAKKGDVTDEDVRIFEDRIKAIPAREPGSDDGDAL